MAFMASDKLSLEINRRRFPRMSRIVDLFMARPGVLIATILVGNNVALVVFGLLFNELSMPILHGYALSASGILLLQTVVSTIIIIVVAEFLPKTLIQRNPSLMLNLLALPLFFFYVVFYPIGSAMQRFAHFLIGKIFGKTEVDENADLLPGRVDLDNLLSKQAETQSSRPSAQLVSQEAKLMKNALDFAKIKVRDCTVPRNEIVAVDINDSLEELREKFVTSHHSKIIVYDETIDNIVGYVSVSELFLHAKNIRSITLPILIIPETMSAKTLLEQFREHHKSMALVVDEFGGTAGIVTLEDVLEEIFGEINDEHDIQIYEERRIRNDEYIFSGRLEIDYLNDKYGLGLPVSDEYDTLAGLILSESRAIPERGEVVEIDGFTFKVVEATHTRVDKVNLLKHRK